MIENRAQVFLCTYGSRGMRNVLRNLHPAIPGVEYVICLQLGDDQPDDISWGEIENREDYKLIKSRTKGIAVNRNIALSNSSAPIAVITDDDVIFHDGGIERLIKDFEEHPEADVISYMFSSDEHTKRYPDYEFNFRDMPRFYYLSAMEVALRPERVRGKLMFNEAFGFHTLFHGGEDDVFAIDVVRSGLNGVFVPHTIVHHSGLSTGTRPDPEYRLIETRGAVTSYRHQYTWPLRMLWRCWCETGKGKQYGVSRYLVHWIKGYLRARRNKVFPTPVHK